MSCPKNIKTYFTDQNNDSILLNINTDAFAFGTINDIINFMVKNPLANTTTENHKTGDTLFFYASEYNPNDDVIQWLINSDEYDINYRNSCGENVIEYLIKSKFNSDKIYSRIKFILDMGLFDINQKNNSNESLLEIASYCGYLQLVKFLIGNGFIYDKEMIQIIIKKLDSICVGECDDYFSLNDKNKEKYLNTLNPIIDYLKTLYL